MKARGLTHTGLVRDKNEDSFDIREHQGLVVVADGMGGHKSGEIASSLAVATLVEEVAVLLTNKVNPEEALRRAVFTANTRIYDFANSEPANTGMGTTLTVALFLDRLYVAHIGDSRLYLWRNGKLQQLTEDHSYVAELVRNGSISADEAGNHPQRNILLKALGTGAELQFDVFALELEAVDIYLLCTDGLHSVLSDQELGGMFEEFTTAESFLDEILERCLAQGAPDNITMVLVKP